MKRIFDKIKLKDYALWYYFKYFPSNKRLLTKLGDKSDNIELADDVFSEVKHLLNEEEIIQSKINNYLARNKNLRYIKQKLREKLFDLCLVEKYLLSHTESGDSLLDKNKTFRKIENYKNKGKSINYIKQKLIERKEDRELVTSCIEEVFGEKGDIENLENEYRKLVGKTINITGIDTQKMASRLIQRGFRYEDIKGVISNDK